MAESGSDNKTEEPTAKRLEDAANKGQVPFTKELGATLGFVGILTVIYWAANMVYGSMSNTFIAVFKNLRPWTSDQTDFMTVIWPNLKEVGFVMLMIMCVAFAIPLIGHVMQKGVKPRPEAAKPDLEKVNPIAGVKKLFSMETLANFIKSFIKAMGLMFIYYLVVRPYMTEIAYSAAMPFKSALALYSEVAMVYVLWAVIFMVAVIIADYSFQKYRHRQKMMMSRQEVKDEMKETEGNPEFKRRLREVQIQRSKRQIESEVPGSTVIVTNPTHFAVALVYKKGEIPIPRVVAKGADLLCARIKEIAKENKVPVVEAPPLARALYRDVKVGENIPRSFYKAVARILGLIFKLEAEKKRQVDEQKMSHLG